MLAGAALIRLKTGLKSTICQAREQLAKQSMFPLSFNQAEEWQLFSFLSVGEHMKTAMPKNALG